MIQHRLVDHRVLLVLRIYHKYKYGEISSDWTVVQLNDVFCGFGEDFRVSESSGLFYNIDIIGAGYVYRGSQTYIIIVQIVVTLLCVICILVVVFY